MDMSSMDMGDSDACKVDVSRPEPVRETYLEQQGTNECRCCGIGTQ